jgi:hypothetical protein
MQAEYPLYCIQGHLSGIQQTFKILTTQGMFLFRGGGRALFMFIEILL